MSVFANEFAYELFDTFMDWYDNWVEEFNSDPPSDYKEEALNYFTNKVIRIPSTKEAFSHWLEYYLEDLVRESGYDYEYLESLFLKDVNEFLSSDEEFTEFVNDFTQITFEHDW